MLFKKDFIPQTVDEAINCIVGSLTPEDIEQIKKVESSSYHHSIGRYLRNNWDMWNTETPLSQDFQKRFKLFGHSDDLSGIILTGVWAKVRGEDVDVALKGDASFFKKHWTERGLDPETGKNL